MTHFHRILSIISCSTIILTGCASGPVFYEPVTKVDKNGNSYVKMEPVFKLDADVEGEEILIETPSTTFKVKGNPNIITETTTTDKKSNVIVTRAPALARIGTSSVVRAKGEAFSQGTKAVSGGIAQGILAGTTVPAVATGLGKVP